MSKLIEMAYKKQRVNVNQQFPFNSLFIFVLVVAISNPTDIEFRNRAVYIKKQDMYLSVYTLLSMVNTNFIHCHYAIVECTALTLKMCLEDVLCFK